MRKGRDAPRHIPPRLEAPLPLGPAAATALAVLPVGYAPFWTLVWCSALALACVLLATRRFRSLEALAWGCMSVPLWTSFWDFVNSIPALVATDDVLLPASAAQLSRMFYRNILIDLGYLVAGFLLWLHVRHGPLRSLRLRDVARHLRDAVPALQRRSEAQSAWTGYALFPALLLGTWGANWFLTSQLPGLVNGDESRFWDNLVPYNTVMISLSAGFTEELAYRALLMTVLWAGLRRLRVPDGAALAGAVVLQAVVFGLAHAGYGTWIHVLLPFFFGLIAGAVAAWRGPWAAIVLHVQVDLYVFVELLPDARYPWASPLLYALFLANTAAFLLWAVVEVQAWRRRRRGLPVQSGRSTW